MNFGENVRRKREALHMTQEELAEKTKVSQQMISHIETGRKTRFFRAIFPGGICPVTR